MDLKVEATRAAFTRCFVNHEISVSTEIVSSGVPAQPMGDTETKQGLYFIFYPLKFFLKYN